MGRPSKGFRLKAQPGTDVIAVAWTQPGKDGERGTPRQQSTGERDAGRAAKKGAQIYAAAIRGGTDSSRARPVRRVGSIERLAEQWLAARTDLDPETKATYALYFETHLGPAFGTLANVHSESVRGYCASRLMCVAASTVRHELSALRMLVRWACPNESADLIVPSLPKSTRGTSHEAATGRRRRGKPTELTEQETLAIISKLPEMSRTPRGGSPTSRFPIRARFIVKYETGLRESLLDQISVPEHWDPATPGELRITPELDKMRYARVVPLTQAAQTALRTVVEARSTSTGVTFTGLLFGCHDYRSAVRGAALGAGLQLHRVKTLAPNDLRHARATHLGASPAATLTGMMHMFGWTQPSTAARYMHPTQEAAREMLSAVAPAATQSTFPTATSASTVGGRGSRSDDDDEGTSNGFG